MYEVAHDDSWKRDGGTKWLLCYGARIYNMYTHVQYCVTQKRDDNYNARSNSGEWPQAEAALLRFFAAFPSSRGRRTAESSLAAIKSSRRLS